MEREYFEEISKHLMEDLKPSEFLNSISKENAFKEYPYNMLYSLKDTPQNLVHHPDNVWNHTMMVVDEGPREELRVRSRSIYVGHSST